MTFPEFQKKINQINFCAIILINTIHFQKLHSYFTYYLIKIFRSNIIINANVAYILLPGICHLRFESHEFVIYKLILKNYKRYLIKKKKKTIYLHFICFVLFFLLYLDIYVNNILILIISRINFFIVVSS